MKKFSICRMRLYLRAWITMCMVLNAISAQNYEGGLTPCEIETLVRQLTNPSQEYQLHAAALRNQLRDLMENEQNGSFQSIDQSGEEYMENDKRSVSSLARNGLLQPGKRYLGALARSGMLGTSTEAIKRSLATLAKNGQLPSQEPESDDDSDKQQWNSKRYMGSVARSGYILGKRNIGSLARDYQLPSNVGKRNLAALARLGFVPSTTPKRNMASMARLNMLPTNSYNSKREAKWSEQPLNVGVKKSLGALKNSPVHGTRPKRSIYSDIDNDENLEFPEDIFQNQGVDYDELRDNLDRLYGQYYGDNLQEEKRFLGSVARSGWFRPQSFDKRNIGSIARLGLLRSDYSRFGSQKSQDMIRQQQQKRHIGALARSGWLPAFRSARSGAFSRSGRARSQIVGYYPQQEQLRQPIAAVCRRCDDVQIRNSVSWGAPGLQSTWGTPPRLTPMLWRSLRPTRN